MMSFRQNVYAGTISALAASLIFGAARLLYGSWTEVWGAVVAWGSAAISFIGALLNQPTPLWLTAVVAILSVFLARRGWKRRGRHADQDETDGESGAWTASGSLDDLEELEAQVVRTIASEDGTAVHIDGLRDRTGVSSLRIESAVEDLLSMGLLVEKRSTTAGYPVHYLLTRRGRDLALNEEDDGESVQ